MSLEICSAFRAGLKRDSTAKFAKLYLTLTNRFFLKKKNDVYLFFLHKVHKTLHPSQQRSPQYIPISKALVNRQITY